MRADVWEGRAREHLKWMGQWGWEIRRNDEKKKSNWKKKNSYVLFKKKIGTFFHCVF